MIKEYDKVKIIKTGVKACVLEIDDDKGRRAPVYLVELVDKPVDSTFGDVVFWSEGDEIVKV